MKNKILILLLFLSVFTYGQNTHLKFSKVYNKVKESNIKFPGLIMALSVAESGFNSYDEDTILVNSFNLWNLTTNKKCNCKVDPITGLAQYDSLDLSIIDLNKRIGKLISGCKDEEQAITVLCWYYLETTDRQMTPNNWKKRLQLIRNDMPY